MTEDQKELNPEEQAAQTPDPQPEETTQPEPQAEPAENASAALAGAKEKAAQLEAQLATAKEQLLRTAAEYDNHRKRSLKEKEGAFNNGVSFAVERLLPVLDTLKLAATAETTDENYKKGVLLTMEKCGEAFGQMGVKEMQADGAVFDPELHAAVMQQPAPEGVESGTVLQVLQPGYTVGEKVLRHATVIVAE